MQEPTDCKLSFVAEYLPSKDYYLLSSLGSLEHTIAGHRLSLYPDV